MRNITKSLAKFAAIATLGLAALTVPQAAQARGFYYGGHHGGFFGGFAAGALVGATYYPYYYGYAPYGYAQYGYAPYYNGYAPYYYGSGCYWTRTRIWRNFAWHWRRVWVCG